MKHIKNLLLVSILSLIVSLPLQNSLAGLGRVSITYSDTDNSIDDSFDEGGLVYFFDLRDRETFIQLTYTEDRFTVEEGILNSGVGAVAHVQIFNVGQNCNENNFNDSYTINDTHVYNMRDILTNDGDPSGVVLPENAYGIVVITVRTDGFPNGRVGSIGNMRIIDNNGYEYRTNAQKQGRFRAPSGILDDIYSFNYNNEEGVTLSDVVGITLLTLRLSPGTEYDAQDVVNIYSPFDVDIYDVNEVPFSCRNVIFSCVNEDNPRIGELLENAQLASVASFEYGINEAIPHSNGGELLCPANIINNGIVNLTPLPLSLASEGINRDRNVSNRNPSFFGYVGLNNGNGRGSFDSILTSNFWE